MIVDSAAADIAYTSRFSGVHGSYLKPSIANAGLDPENLAENDKSAMDFAKREKDGGAKAWKDIWSAGQGVGTIDDIPKTEDLIMRLADEYDAARRALAAG